MVQIRLNGKLDQVSEGATIAQLLESKGVNPVRVAVELNRRILRRDEFASTQLKADDVVEIVTFVGGGCLSRGRLGLPGWLLPR